MSNTMRICAVIPSHNHSLAVPRIVAGLREHGLPVFIIDDGSDPQHAAALAGLASQRDDVSVARLEPNQGKGGAVLHGFQLAIAAGFTHALQIDADGQHDLGAVAQLLTQSRARTDALVAGVPIYDSSVPLGRAIGRYATHIWVWIETLSLAISDSMCGLRVYPLSAVASLLRDGEPIGRRMDFDTEIMVRLFWRGVPIVEHPVAVTYPVDNTSNFDLWRDNLRITRMHTRLFFGMLRRFPRLLRHRQTSSRHWASITERGAYAGLQVAAGMTRLLGRQGCLCLLAPVVLYFYLTGQEQRRASADFLRTVRHQGAHLPASPPWTLGLRHFMSFAGRAVDTFIGWTGRMSPDAIRPGRVSDLSEAERSPAGAVIIVGHLGNVDLARALLDDATRQRLLVLVHTRHAENYNRLLREFRPEAAINTWQVTDLGPAAAMELKARVEQGAWVVIAGDRIPVNSDRVSDVLFLGRRAPFSQGPYILASLLECPVYTLFCVRRGEHYQLDVEKLADKVLLPRQGREEALETYAAAFAARLERYAINNPLQWYNFFNFWNPARRGASS
ncbi:glycosyltransferase family 2 protein [Dongia rigui]|uniref:Glycosyltransferase n=1 Tax=Dongia rigui TaxID=940149 RepID=A0ABU5E1A3_9PROT|nr:glycosyltransferase [Dongia rigui]MDY0873330.1 glycosyltransferase [Dongia rigui]